MSRETRLGIIAFAISIGLLGVPLLVLVAASSKTSEKRDERLPRVEAKRPVDARSKPIARTDSSNDIDARDQVLAALRTVFTVCLFGVGFVGTVCVVRHVKGCTWWESVGYTVGGLATLFLIFLILAGSGSGSAQGQGNMVTCTRCGAVVDRSRLRGMRCPACGHII